jgi:hypothetical protein
MATGGDVSGKVTPPAICLMVAAGLNILMSLYLIFSGVSATLLSGQIGKDMKATSKAEAEAASAMVSGVGIGYVLWGVLALLCAGVIIMAGIKMKSLQSYNLVMAGTVLAMIPCTGPCCIVSLPLGIWALVVLMSPDVKAAFH